MLRNSRPEFRLLALLAMDVFIFPSVFSMMARMVILYSENVFRWYKISVLYGVVVGRRRLSDVDCVSVGIGGTENLV